MPVGALSGGLHDGLVVDAPADKILAAVSLEGEFVGTLVADSLLELLVAQACREVRN